MRLERIATDLGEPLLRVEYLDEQRHLIVHYLEPVSWLSKQLLYRLRGGERGGGARGGRRASRPAAPCRPRGAAVVQMGAAEEDRIAVRRDAAVERAERQAVKRGARPGRGGAEERLGGGEGEAARGRVVLLVVELLVVVVVLLLLLMVVLRLLGLGPRG